MVKSPASAEPPEPHDPATIAEWVRRIAGNPDRRKRARLLTVLVRRTPTESDRVTAFQLLSRIATDGPRLALVYLSRLPGSLPPSLIALAVPLFGEEAVSSTARIAAAGRCLDAVADRSASVGPILTALTGGLSRIRVLERLIRLQSRVKSCQTLDKTINTTERKVQYPCMMCRKTFTRRQYIQHLWVQHRLTYQRGKRVEPQPFVEQAINAATRATTLAATNTVTQADDPSALDMAFAVSRLYYPDVPIHQVLQAILARSPADPAQLGRLLELAAEQQAGLCPVCLTTLPDRIPPLPPPLSLAGGRLAGDGYAVDIQTSRGTRSATIQTRTGEQLPAPVFPRWSGRILGLLIAFPLLLLAGVLAVLLPGDSRSLWIGTLGCVAAAWLGYFAARGLRQALPDPNTEAVRLAWETLVPGIGRRLPAVRFLIRLCRASLGEGDIPARAPTVWEMVEQSAILADKGGVYLQFLAAIRVLQVYDAAVQGRDRVSGLASLLDPFFQGEIAPIYAEATAESLLDPPGLLRNGERGRLAVLLLHSAFQVGFQPIDLDEIGSFLPWFRRLLGEADRQTLELLRIIWQDRSAQRTGSPAGKRSIFELARASPTESTAILAQFPDAWFVLETDPVHRAELGPIVLARSGLMLAGKRLTDPDEPIEQVSDEQGTWFLYFGKHQVRLRKKLPAALMSELRNGLRERFRLLNTHLDRTPTSAPTQRTTMILAPLVQTCPLCQTAAVVRTGTLGRKWADIIPTRG